MSEEYYCPEHKYNPPENSGFLLCPQCELAGPTGSEKREWNQESKPWAHAVRCPHCRHWMDSRHDTECLNCGKLIEAEIEREKLRAAQSRAVMPLIGGLLDAWDGLSNDIKSDPELEHFKKHIEGIDEAMENPQNNQASP